MTSDTRDLRTTEQQRPDPPDRIQLSAVQVAASALASVSAAVVASLFGVAGTVVGAGLVAIISTSGSAIYSASMKRTSNQLRRAREQLLTARAGEARAGNTREQRATSSTAVLERSGRGGHDRDGTSPVDARESGSDESGSNESGGASRWRRGWLTVGSRTGLKWPALVGAAALVFALAIGAITAFEAITSKPISALTGHSTSSSTTLGSLTESSESTPDPEPSATESGSGSDADETTPSSGASATPSPREGGGGATVPDSQSSPDPAPSASTAPSSAAPQGGTGSGSGSGTGSGTGSGSGSGSGSGDSGTSQEAPAN